MVICQVIKERYRGKGLIMVPRSCNARRLRTSYVPVDAPCVHRKGLTGSSQIVLPSVKATQQQGL
jgi:hypothetical protein